MQLILVKKLVEAIGSSVIFFVLLVHDVDVVNKLDQELLHALRSRHELHDLIKGAIQLRFNDLTVDLEVLLESLECC